MSSSKNLALEANTYSLWGNVSWKRSLDFRKSYSDPCCPGCFPQEHGPHFNLRKNVDLMQGLSLGHVPFVVTPECYVSFTLEIENTAAWSLTHSLIIWVFRIWENWLTEADVSEFYIFTKISTN